MFQLNITHQTKNKEDLTLNEKTPMEANREETSVRII
jgi:hypothetical protein